MSLPPSPRATLSPAATALLACPACKRLVHAAELKRLPKEALRATKAGDLTTALTAWRHALELLAADTRQYGTIAAKVAALSRQVDASRATAAGAAAKNPSSATRTGPLGAIGLVLWKFKFVRAFLLTKGKLLLLGLTKASTPFSMLLSLGV